MPNPSKTSSTKRRSAKAPLSRTPQDGAVAAVLESYPKPIASKLLALRKLILDTARATEGVGALEEALKWGQVSYLTSESKSGSTVRIDRVKSAEGQVAVYFHCQTILLEASRKLPEEELRHCVALALTYHRSKREK